MSHYYLYGISKNHIAVMLELVFLCEVNKGNVKFFLLSYVSS